MRNLIVMVLLTALCCTAVPASAEAPDLMTYQGRLQESGASGYIARLEGAVLADGPHLLFPR